MNVSFTYWNLGEPTGGTENCLFLNTGIEDPKWHDYSCDDDQYIKPLCQITISTKGMYQHLIHERASMYA